MRHTCAGQICGLVLKLVGAKRLCFKIVFIEDADADAQPAAAAHQQADSAAGRQGKAKEKTSHLS